MYIDPPYFKAEKHYEGFSLDDHSRLLRLVTGVKGKFVLSYNDAPKIREMYAGFNIHALERPNSLKNKTGVAENYRELVITNFTTG